MKFFSFLDRGEIHLAPGTKILPSEEFSTLLNAQELLKKTQEDIVAYKIKMEQQAEDAKAEAKKEGFQEGFKEWGEQIALLEKETQKVHGELEKYILPIALKAARKIVGKAIELSQDTIMGIISNQLKEVAEHRFITVYVGRKDEAVLNENKKKLEAIFGRLESLSIQIRDDIESGGCIIETEQGIVDARIENLWGVLEKAFDKILQAQKQPSLDNQSVEAEHAN